MKKWIILAALLLLQWQTAFAANVLDLEIPEDRAVVVIEEETGQVLYTQNEDAIMYPASLTKLMTALVVLDESELDDTFVPGEEMGLLSSQSSKAYLVQGESISIKDALAGLLLPSGSDAAMALAVYTARVHEGDSDLSIEDALDVFVTMMNEKAQELGMDQSRFANPHGLHDSEHYTTAGDLLLLTQAVLEYPYISELVAQAFYETEDQKYQFASTNVYLHTRLDDVMYLYQTGDNLQYRSEVTGVKTGYTSQAGRCLIFRAESEDKSLIGIVLHSDMPQVYDEGIQIMDQVFYDLDWLPEPSEGSWEESLDLAGVLFLPGTSLKLDEVWSPRLLLTEEQRSDITYSLKITSDKLQAQEDGSYRLAGSLDDGEEVGMLEVIWDGEVIDTAPVQVVKGRSVMAGYLPFAALAVVGLVIIAGILIRFQKRKGLRL